MDARIVILTVSPPSALRWPAVDLNVPLDKADEVTVTDDTRLRAIVPTAKVRKKEKRCQPHNLGLTVDFISLPSRKFLLDKNAKLVLCSHFGRPKGEIIEKVRMDQGKELREKLRS